MDDNFELNLKDARDASDALVRWLQSQDIAPQYAIEVMVMALGVAIRSLANNTNDEPEAIRDLVAGMLKEMKFD